MKWVSYTRSISSRIGEENPSNTIAEQNERIARYLKKRGCSVSEKYSDRKRTAEATEGFDKLVQDGMARKFDAVVVDSLLWILSSAVEEPFRLPLKHCRGRSIRLVSNLQLWKMTFAVQKKLPKKLQSISMERPLIRFVRNLLPIARITLKKVH